jgi:hypothetical protein
MLTAIHTAAAVTPSTAVSGWHANDVARAGQGQLAGSGELGCELA